MKNLKPAVLGGLAGAGLMFVALQYHIIHSHDGLQFVPRAPRTSLGLAYADIREWKTDQFSDNPQLVRALVAHGASDLIANSVRRDLADSLDVDGGTIGDLRALLNESLTSDLDDPLFDDEDDTLTIPFPPESRRSMWDDPFVDSGFDRDDRHSVADRSRHEFNDDRGFGRYNFEDLSSESVTTGPVNRRSSGRERAPIDPFAAAENEFRSRRSSRPSAAEERRQEASWLEKLLFSEEEEEEEDSSGFREIETDDEFGDGFHSARRSLDARASRAVEEARDSFGRSVETARRHSPTRSPDIGVQAEPHRSNVPKVLQLLQNESDPFLR